MGISQFQRQMFQERYQVVGAGRARRRGSSSCGEEHQRIYQTVLLESSSRAAGDGLKELVSNKINCPSQYVSSIWDCFTEDGNTLCGESSKMVLVYLVGGISLQQTLTMRQQHKSYEEVDALYVVQCVLQALSYFERQGEEYACLTADCVVVDEDLVVKLVDTFIVANQRKNIRAGGQGEARMEVEECRRRQSGWVELINKIDDSKGDRRTFNLLSLGLIALEMVVPNFKVQSLLVIINGRQELDWLRLRKAIKTLKNDALREKIWVLTSEYPRERLEVFDSLNPHFSNPNYPRELLLRGTSFTQDLKLMSQAQHRCKIVNTQSVESLALTHISQSKLEYSNAVPNYTFQLFREDINDRISRSQPFYQPHTTLVQQVPILREEVVPLNRSHRITFNIQKSDIMSKSTPTTPVVSEFKTDFFSGLNGDFKSNQNVFLQKIKSERSEETRKSNLITNSDIKSSRKEPVQCEAYHLDHSFDGAMNEQTSSKQQLNHQTNPITQIEIQTTTQNLQNLMDEQQSFVLVDMEDDEQSEQAIKADINDICNLNARHYSADRPVEDQWNPIHLKQDFSKAKSSFIEQIIEEESVENSMTEEEQTSTEFVLQEYSSGSRYEGYKKNGVRHGYGKFHFHSGQIYDGDWKNNKMDGYGKLYYSQSIVAYEGYWKNDSFHGRGKLYNENPAFMKTPCDYNDLSQCENSWMVYQGYFSEDLRSGKGRLTFQNGEYFQGNFRGNLAQGEGYFMRENGSLIHGLWKQSMLISLF